MMCVNANYVLLPEMLNDRYGIAGNHLWLCQRECRCVL